MANNWKYSSLNQRERANLIKEGNDDVYTSEKANNKALKKARINAGMSTKDVDDWDNYIDVLKDNADRQASSTKSIRSNFPKFVSAEEDRIYNLFKSEADKIDEEYQAQRQKTNAEAQKSLDVLEDALAEKGLSKQGSTHKKIMEQAREDINRELEEIAADFAKRIAAVRKKYYND